MSPGEHSDWPILGHYSPVMPKGRQQGSTPKEKVYIINNLLTSKVQPLCENLKPRPCHIDLASVYKGSVKFEGKPKQNTKLHAKRYLNKSKFSYR